MRPAGEGAVDTRFWLYADRLLAAGAIVVDRPRGSKHPRYPDFEYPLDYGYVQNTTSADGEGIDLWRGTLDEQRVTGVIVAVDLLKREAEVKLLVGCSAEEADLALTAHQSGSQAAVLVSRPSERAEAFSATPDASSHYEVELVQIETQSVAGIRAVTTRSEIVSTLKLLAPEIVEYLQEVAVSTLGVPYVRYFHSGADRADLEVGMIVSGEFQGNSRVEPGELPGGRVATIIHTGPFDELAAAYSVLVEWIRDHGYQEVGSPWEVFLAYDTDDFESTAARTQIYWPIL